MAPLYIGKKAADEKALFRPGTLMKTKDMRNCEFYQRLGVAATLAASAVDHGGQALLKRISNVDDADEDSQKALAQTGLGAFAMRFQEGHRAEFLDSAETLNVGRHLRGLRRQARERERGCCNVDA